MEDVQADIMKLWPTQIKAIEGTRAAFREHRFPCVVSHTGSGKSKVMREMTAKAIAKGKRVALFVHRRILRDQVIQQFKDEGFDFGVIASGYKETDAPIQICMNQTAWARYSRPEADLVLWDELHVQSAGNCATMQRSYRENGAYQVGFTATPVNVSADSLVVASSFQDCLDQGSHLPAKCFGPDRPEWWKYSTQSNGEYSPKDNSRLMQNIYGRVYDHWKLYNPDAHPAILFASSSEASRWWCHLFRTKGVRWASIDCERIYWNTWENGKLVTKVHENTDSVTSRDIKQEIFEGHKSGRFKGLSNRFILREAWDAPYVYHCIIATMMGSVATYLQSVGRVMRSHPNYDHKLIQDHGGVIDRLGRPDIERDWHLGESANQYEKRTREQRQKKEADTGEINEICCFKCGAYRTHGASCPECGTTSSKRIKQVIQEDGTLKEIPHKPHQIKGKTAQDVIMSAIFKAVRGRGNFSVGQVYMMAKQDAKRQKIDWKYSDIKVDLPQDFKLKAKEVFTWAR